MHPLRNLAAFIAVLPKRNSPNYFRRFVSLAPVTVAPVTSHLSMAPLLLGQTLIRGDVVIDATAGNGHDSLTLAQLVLPSNSSGRLICFDIQHEALETTRNRLLSEFSSSVVDLQVSFLHQNHRDLTAIDHLLPSAGAKAFVYNLGYLPGGDKTVITQVQDTLISLQGARERLAPGGLIAVTCYRGHAGGREETELVRAELSSWEQAAWRVCELAPLNWPASPILFTAHRFEVE
jgi:hypothetical protein